MPTYIVFFFVFFVIGLSCHPLTSKELKYLETPPKVIVEYQTQIPIPLSDFERVKDFEENFIKYDTKTFKEAPVLAEKTEKLYKLMQKNQNDLEINDGLEAWERERMNMVNNIPEE